MSNNNDIYAIIAKDTLDEADCLAIINSPGDEFGPIDATGLLELKLGGSIEFRFKRLNTTMVRLLEDVKMVFPDAQYYTASGGFNLMIGPSHDKNGQTGQQELLALNGRASVGDGDF